MRKTIDVTRALLRRIPLPQPDAGSDKDARGRVLAMGGSAQTAGAILLAGVAALRAGAGKLQLATVRTSAAALGVAVPESLVVALAEGRAGEIAGDAAGRTLSRWIPDVDALLIGPGMSSDRAALVVLRALVPRLHADATLVLDAAAILASARATRLLRHLGRAVLTPHAGEMASLLGIEKEAVEDDPATVAREAAAHLGVVVALKGPETWIAEPDGTLYHYSGGSVGLATSGSGDTLAGIVAGLAARGASAAHAAVWGAYLHGAAGQALARRLGPIGYLARELLDEVPGV
ncbi:MAG: NAD(P)H-hydrate dehydratase, partial [Gemmatimonadota bacterium]|nr:NAD(P)H-hydrate dehydratase [Gemmatimonadota bacterium]